MRSRSAIPASMVCASLGLIAAGGRPAAAQEGPPAAAAPSGHQIEEVIVLARKRAESAQSVPIAMTALSGAALEARGVSTLADVGRFAPNLTFDAGQGVTGGSSSASVYIRGIGQNESSATADPGVAVYVDGVYLGRSVGSLLDVLDLDHIEVLRGPQGTLFGKNTIGGAVNIISRAPTGDLGGFLEGNFGRFDERNVRAGLNLPVGDEVAARLAASFRQRDGYARSLTSGADFGDVDRVAGHGVLQWTPNDDAKLTLVSDVSRQREHAQFIRPIAFSQPLPAAVVTYNALVASSTPIGAFDARWLPNEAYTNFATGPNASELDAWGVSGTLEWGLTPGLAFTSITAYRDQDVHIAIDSDGSPLDVNHQTYDTDQRQFSQEIRLSGTSYSDRVNWTTGLYYFDEKIDDFVQVRLLAGLFQATGNSNLDRFTDQRMKPHNKADAAFAQGTFALTPKFSVTGGARYNHEKKTINASSRRAVSGVVLIPEGTTREQEWDSWTSRLGVEYQPRLDRLLYASVAQGFKSGGYNYQVAFPTDFMPYDPEEALAYEIGFKTDWWDRRLRVNGALYVAEYTDMQLRYRAGPGQFGCPVNAVNCSLVVNAAEVQMRGGELEITARPADALELLAGIGYIRDEFKEIDPLLVSGNVANFDTQLPKTPEWTYNFGAQYRFALADLGSLTLRSDYSYKDEVFQELSNSPRLRQEGFGLLSARIAFDSADGRWQVALSGQNLTNEVYITSGSVVFAALGYDSAVLGMPRTWTASLRYAFGE